jgi:MFS family permease
MVGFALGGVITGRIADRFGIVPPLMISTLALGAGYMGSALTADAWSFALLHLLVGFGSSAGFAPLIADISHWFTRRRGIAVAICASGNYVGGTIWPPVVQYFIAGHGLRLTQLGIGLFCLVAMGPFIRVMRRHKTSNGGGEEATGIAHAGLTSLGLSAGALQALLCIAGVACCVAMSMPQVHIVAYCSDLGYGVARGAEMLSLMLGFGIISRIASGFIADWIGGLRTLLLGSALQGLALLLYLFFDGLTPLYVISALFGLFQGGIVPMYAVLVREYFPPQEAGTRLGLVIMATIAGMALGGWMSGAIFDLTGSYWQAFANGLMWNFVNVSIVVFLLQRRRTLRAAVA